jgi:hypothetical protein
VLYGAMNVAFALLLGIGSATSNSAAPHFIYLSLLFALCSSFVIDIDRLNGRHALLALYLLVYFVSYGALDVARLFSEEAAPLAQSDGALVSKTEAVILVGGFALAAGYRLMLYIANTDRTRRVPRDWSVRSILIAGPVLWGIGTYATYDWYVHIVTDTTNEAVRRGLASVGTLTASAYILMQMLQPIGILLLAYAWRAFAPRSLLPVIVGMVILQVLLGFVIDIKGTAMIGGILVIITCVLVDGRLPKSWLVAFVMFVVLVFPIFQAYRVAIHGDRGLSRTAVLANFGTVLELTLAQSDKVNTGSHRAQTFLERSTVKGSTQVIVEKTGVEADFQRGNTLTPILAAFIPRILWTDKPDIPTGQIMNKVFHVAEGDDVYISPSHLGELYWNFGWFGVVIGMALIGAIIGWVGACFNLAEYRTVTRILVTVVTIKQMIVGIEGVIAAQYVVWLRSLAGIGILHLIFARVPAVSLLFRRPQTPAPAAGNRLYPNLLT